MAQRVRSDNLGVDAGGVQIVGMKELRRELKKLENPREWTKKLTAIHRENAKNVAAWAQGEARGMGRSPQAKFAKMIRGYGRQTGARVGLSSPVANAAFWGAKQRTGWNAGNSTPNLPEWVGNSWQVGGPGGPYAINPAIRNHMDDIIRAYREGIDDLVKQAFDN